MKKKYIVFIGIGLFTSLGIWYAIGKASEPVESEKETFSKAFSGTLESSIKVTGKTNLVNEQKLKFTQIGTVKNVFVTNGRSVKKR
jgi:multidrug efflux pump subunit AcrA (membrane-fusion protein)